MVYYIISVVKNHNTIISKHSSLNDAMCAGKYEFEKLGKHTMVACLGSNDTLEVNNDGQLIGKYKLFHAWF